MAVTDKTEIQIPKKFQENENILGRTHLWVQPKSNTEQKAVHVVYFLSRNGQLEHPHYIEVTLSSPEGLYLRDVRNALNLIRGQGMASMYSWSSKRSYKNGYVWQDLSDKDLIYPCHEHEYILKGSLLIENSLSFRSFETISSLSTTDLNSSTEESDSIVTGTGNHSRTACDDLDEHKVYKAKTSEEFVKKGANVSTQTDHGIRRLKRDTKEGDGTELNREELCPTSLNSSSKHIVNLERSIEVYESADVRCPYMGSAPPSRRMKASLLVMKFIRCGSRRFNEFEQ